MLSQLPDHCQELMYTTRVVTMSLQRLGTLTRLSCSLHRAIQDSMATPMMGSPSVRPYHLSSPFTNICYTYRPALIRCVFTQLRSLVILHALGGSIFT